MLTLHLCLLLFVGNVSQDEYNDCCCCLYGNDVDSIQLNHDGLYLDGDNDK